MAPLYRFVRRITPLFLLFLAAVPLPARSQTLTIDEMTRRAAVIVEGQVASVTSAWNASHTQIFTSVHLQVARFHKGGTGLSTLDFRLLGGSVGDMSMVVVDQPTFKTGESVFLFLNPTFATGDVAVVGQYEGKLLVTANAQGADILVGSSRTFAKNDVVASIRTVMRAAGR